MRKAVLIIGVALVLGLTGTSATGAPNAPNAPQAAPQPGAAGIGDPYFPSDGNGGYDVAHYDLDVGYTPATNELTGKAKISARAAQSLSRFNLDLVGLKVDSIKVNGDPANWKRAGQELQITPRRAVKKDRKFTVVVRYHGIPTLLNEPALGEAGFFETEDGAVVIGQPHVAATWFPVNDHPLDKASYDVAITVPRGVEAISNGKLDDVRSRKGLSTWSWEEKAPMASYLVTATTGQFQLTQYKKGGIRYLDAIDPTLFQKPEPRTGRQFALSGGDDNGYKRLSRTFAVPAAGGELSFALTRNTEPDWDFFAVEAHTVGADNWTTLPDGNGHSSTDTGASCFSWQAIHPFLAHYQATDGDECTPTGTTGAWNAASGASDGYETWSVDLGAYAGQQVEIALSVISDDSLSYSGAFVDDIVGPNGVGSTSFENDADALDGWQVPGPPSGSPGNVSDWRITDEDPRPTVGDNAAAALAKEPEIIGFLSGVLGRYPFKQAGGIVDNDPGLGFALENQTRPIYGKVFFELTSEDNDSVVVHELAHQWTGDDLSVRGWRDIWLNEGFATYMEWLWSEAQDRGTADEIFAGNAEIEADSPFWELTIGDPGPERLFDQAVYVRGAMTLHALRQEIGDEAFFRLLKRWTATYSGGNVRSEQFIAMAERVSGRQLDALFQTWLYTPSKPAGLEAIAKKPTQPIPPSLTKEKFLRR